ELRRPAHREGAATINTLLTAVRSVAGVARRRLRRGDGALTAGLLGMAGPLLLAGATCAAKGAGTRGNEGILALDQRASWQRRESGRPTGRNPVGLRWI